LPLPPPLIRLLTAFLISLIAASAIACAVRWPKKPLYFRDFSVCLIRYYHYSRWVCSCLHRKLWLLEILEHCRVRPAIGAVSCRQRQSSQCPSAPLLPFCILELNFGNGHTCPDKFFKLIKSFIDLL
jgi:hypothetical protein